MRMLETVGLRKEFGTLVAVNDVNLRLDQGHVMGLIGPNGAGKTTLLRILATLLKPTGGTARVLGSDLLTEFIAIRKRIGYVPDFFNLPNDLTIVECLTFFARAYGLDRGMALERVDAALDYIDLQDKRNEFIRHLSRGMVQRLGLGTQLVHDPELFLLDEPASGLDPIARVQLRNVLKRLSGEGKSVIISSHILSELSDFCTHIALMNKGRMVVCGGVDEIRGRMSGTATVVVAVLEDSAQAAALLDGLDGVRVVDVRDNTITVEVPKGQAKLAWLNAFLVEKHVKVTGFSEKKASIEELFLEMAEGN